MNIDVINTYAEQHSSAEPPLLQELAAFTRREIPGAQMLCGRVEGRLLKWLVGFVRAKYVLELGTFTGYSALSMAEALPDEGYVLTCDQNATVWPIAQAYVEKSPHGHKVQLSHETALPLLHRLIAEKKQFDFMFLDADKKNNPEYIALGLELLSPHGLIAVDNTWMHGSVLNPEEDRSKIIAQMNHDLVNRTDIEVLFLPIRDGLTLIRKLSA